MQKKCKLLSGLAALAVSHTAYADWEATVGYSQIGSLHSQDSLGVAVVGIDYQYPLSRRISVVPGVYAGVGVRDTRGSWAAIDVIDGDPVFYAGDVNIAIDKYYGIGVQTRFDLNSAFYLFVTPTYFRLELDGTVLADSFEPALPANASDFSFTTNDGWRFGLGFGGGFNINDALSIEAGYENLSVSKDNGGDLLNLKARIRF